MTADSHDPHAPNPSRWFLPTEAMGRRRFLAVAGGLAVTACSGSTASETSGATAPGPSSTSEPRHAVPSTAGPGSATTVPIAGAPAPSGDRVLVVVSLDGGNDAVNTLPPDLGSYRDLRPGLAIEEADLLRHVSLPGHGLHPALAPLVPLLDEGALAVVAGVGFPDPDRSHFTSIDRWDRADRMEDPTGWLGRWLDGLDTPVPALGATALGSGGSMLAGATIRPSVVDEVDAFAFPDTVAHGDIRALAGDRSDGGGNDADDDQLRAAARAAFADSVGAVEEFDAVADAVREGEHRRGRGSGPITDGLAIAAELIRSRRGTRLVSVAVDGFDTHSNQLGQHQALLADLAGGIARFWDQLDASGDRERVLVMTTSEFGRRLAENGSAGTDHGSAGLSFLLGARVRGGLHGAIDTDAPADGDLAPIVDPRTIYTAALDHLGGDVDAVLGHRWDEIPLFV